MHQNIKSHFLLDPLSFSPDPLSFSPDPLSFSPDPLSFSPYLIALRRFIASRRLKSHMTSTFLILFLQGLDDEVAIRTRADQLVQFSRGTLRAFHVSVCKCAKAVQGEDSLLTGALRLERTLHAAPVDVASGAAACKWKGRAATC